MLVKRKVKRTKIILIFFYIPSFARASHSQIVNTKFIYLWRHDSVCRVFFWYYHLTWRCLVANIYGAVLWSCFLLDALKTNNEPTLRNLRLKYKTMSAFGMCKECRSTVWKTNKSGCGIIHLIVVLENHVGQIE